MQQFEILPGLPPYGPPAEGFSATGQGKHREGVVVRFFLHSGESWVGNFQRGLAWFDAAFNHPNGSLVVVIAGGQAYIVDPENRRCTEEFGAQIEIAFEVPELNAIIFGNGLWFDALGSGGFLWRSKRISWDGMRDIAVNGLTLSGKAWSLENWEPFTLNLATGDVARGAYREPDGQTGQPERPLPTRHSPRRAMSRLLGWLFHR